jgi:hypothetical protein
MTLSDATDVLVRAALVICITAAILAVAFGADDMYYPAGVGFGIWLSAGFCWLVDPETEFTLP